MATYYWVGGAGTWNASSTTNWASSSGGTGGAGFPTSADDVIIDGSSGTGQITCTGAVCNNITVTASQAIYLGAVSSTLSVYGNLTFPAGGSFSAAPANWTLTFAATSTGKTITTNGKTVSNLVFNGVGGGWTLGSALTLNSNILTLVNGTLDTSAASSFAISGLNSITLGSGTKQLNLNASTVTTTAGISFATNGTGFTLNAGTSTIVTTGNSPTFAGNGNTFYNVSFTGTAITNATITGANTFNNFTVAPKAASGVSNLLFGANQTINGTFTVQTGASDPTKRFVVTSDTAGTQRTIFAATVDINCVDFKDISASGAASWSDASRTKYWGDCAGNSNITFAVGRSVYWNLAGSQNWSATGWASTNSGTPNLQYFPLAQDTATFTEAGAAGTVTLNAPYSMGTLQMSDGVSNRVTAFTLALGSNTFSIYGNINLFSSLTITGSATPTIANRGITQTIKTFGVVLPTSFNINALNNGVAQLVDNFTTSALGFTLTAGTIDLNDKTLSCASFASTGSLNRTIAFGSSGVLNVTGTGIVWSTSGSNISSTGTSVVNFSYSGSSSRSTTITGFTESTALNFNVTAGTDTFSMNNAIVKSLNFTGFAGTLSASNRTIYGDLTFSSGMTLSAGVGITTFAATSGTKTITTNGKTLDFPLNFNGIGGTWAFADALTQGSTRAFTITNGTVQLKNGVTSTVGSFVTSGTNQKYLQSTLAGSQATLLQVSNTVNVSYLTIQDINATGGATWNAYYTNGNIDGGNNTNWNFGGTPSYNAEYGYKLRSFTETGRF